MTKKAVLVVLAGCFVSALALAGDSHQGYYNRVALSNGESGDLFIHTHFNQDRSRTRVILREQEGHLLGLVVDGSRSPGPTELEFAEVGQGTRLKMSYDLSLHPAGLQTPLSVEINGERFVSNAEDRKGKAIKKARHAVRKLPRGFVNSLRRLYEIAEGGSTPMPPLSLIHQLFDEGELTDNGVSVVDTIPLSQSEIEALRSAF